jgi:beta-galactosidase
MPRNGHLEWRVAYRPGVLEARGYRHGQVVQTERVATTGPAAKLVLTPDRTTVRADGQDVVVFTASAVDAEGRAVPTADTSVQFSVTGGRVLGVGNGDPSSHEPDCFVGAVHPIAIENWRGRIAPAGTTEPSAGTDFQPLAAMGNWLAPRPKDGQVYDLAAEVTLAADPGTATLELLLPSFGARTSVWLNGELLAREADSAKAGPALTLRAAQLKTGANRIQLVVTPFADHQNHLPETTRVGSLCLRTPAPPAARSLFNGLAQVIVQPSGAAGTLQLTAQASGVAAAATTVTVTP